MFGEWSLGELRPPIENRINQFELIKFRIRFLAMSQHQFILFLIPH